MYYYNIVKLFDYTTILVLNFIVFFFLFIVIPNNFLSQIVSATIYLLSMILVFLPNVNEMSSRATITLIIAFVVALSIGLVVSYRTNKWRRKLFYSYMKENELKQKVSENNDYKNKLFSIIAHDLRTPFGTLKNSVDYIKSNIEDITKPEVLDLVRGLSQSSEKINSMLENLLNWVKIQMDNVEIHPRKIELYDLVEKIIELYRESALNKNIELVNVVNDKLSVKADEQSLGITLRNVLSNAIKFSFLNSEVIVDASARNGMSVICISDKGVGIPEELVDKILNGKLLFTSDGTGNEKGSGLGLLLAREFVEKNNGKMWIQSELNRGTKVFFSLPST
ncbi:MAG: HAMP domain-containing histidine kinase [Melioribacteraceae bacterium]|nr:HAMP domain-containing histidine kinase [Melioribacteraceae bacterium]